MQAPTLHTFNSPAKLNLFLHITGVREDGYHNLQTVFQFLDLHDTLTFEDTHSDGHIYLGNNIQGVPEKENLVYKAAMLLRQHTNSKRGARISIDKKLPMGGGLGGGSSNAATTLVALNQLWNTKLTTPELEALGVTLGADIPIFVHGVAAWAEGVGEQLTSVTIDEPWYLLAIPACHVETAKLFQDKQLTRNTKAITMRAFLNGASHNDFEPIAKKKFPLINKTLDLLNEWGNAKLTGTGACCFCPVPNKETGLKALSNLPEALVRFDLKSDDLEVILTKGENGSSLYQSSQLSLKDPLA
ncbi:4-(cytidine 5'-diphospho)-2-C-methyl-D-erythritol kinase [Gammaproteobacteria bacterium 42_54_T18]|nr:4-(cytidine 5'-diphospho)-2-C-methyl-D-erythritol kinase [Gammaproteobacteria bacterium 42_54_T18]